MSLPSSERLFRLPVGLRDSRGHRHRRGVLRAATAKDELRTLQDFRVHLRPESFLPLMLARTIVRLGDLTSVDLRLVESLCGADLDELEKIYRGLNGYPALIESDDQSPMTTSPDNNHVP